MTLPVVSEVLLTLAVLVLFVTSLGAIFEWRLALRREVALFTLVAEVGSVDPFDEQLVEAAIARGMRAWREEHDAQLRWRKQSSWRRVTTPPPQLGERWP